MIGLKLTTFIPMTFILLSQAQTCSQDMGGNPFGRGDKAERSYESIKKGDISGALNKMTDAPCATCEQEKSTSGGWSLFGTHKNFKKVHMLASVANLNCLNSKGRFLKGDLPPFNSKNAHRSEKRRVESLMKGIAQAAGPTMAAKMLSGVDIRFFNSLGNRSGANYCIPAHQLRGYISVSRACTKNYDDNTVDALIVHEIGHYAAGRAGLYAQYNKAVSNWHKCKVTGYCTKASSGKKHSNRHEEFAEVFSAYLLATDRLKSMCPKSYDFMKTHVFKGQSKYFCSEK